MTSTLTKTGAFIVAADSLVVVIDGKNYTISKTSALYRRVKDAVVSGNWDNAVALLEQANSLKGEIWWNDAEGLVYYGQEPLNHALADRIPTMLNEGFDTTPMINFMKNLFLNPAEHAIQELYEFMEKNALPITEDGCLLAYKKVRDDYMDCHTGTVDNHIGQKPFMDRNLCDPNRHNTCSTGYHFCGLSYLTCFGGERVMVVKVNPKDVTSIPSDYNFAKGRCNTYEVVDEYGGTDVQRIEAWTSSVAPSEFLDEEDFNEFYCEDCGTENPDDCDCCSECGDCGCIEEVEDHTLFTPEPEIEDVTNPITLARLKAGLSADQVAEALDGMPVSTYLSRIEVEGRFFRPATVGRILQVIHNLADKD